MARKAPCSPWYRSLLHPLHAFLQGVECRFLEALVDGGVDLHLVLVDRLRPVLLLQVDPDVLRK